MNASKLLRVTVLTIAMSLLIAACDSDGAELSTTTSSLLTDSDGTQTTTTTTPVSESTTTTGFTGQAVEGSEVVARQSTDDGDVLYIVIPQGAYTDVDLENFVGDLLEEEIVTWGAEIFDDALAADAYQKAEADRTEDEVELISGHHFVSILHGDTIRFQGPFEESGEFVIGS